MKHIEVRHHFTWDHVEKGYKIFEFVSIDYQLVDIFTKTLSEGSFNFICQELGLLNFDTCIEGEFPLKN